jgi:hypothetical protein
MKVRILMVCVVAVCVVLAASTVNSQEHRTATTATASAPAEVQTLTGTVESTKTRKMPRLVVDEKRYELVAAEKADEKVKGVIEGISKGEVTGTYTVKGAVTPASPGKVASIKVVSIVKAEARQ